VELKGVGGDGEMCVPNLLPIPENGSSFFVPPTQNDHR
jgi:hypothetical protein